MTWEWSHSIEAYEDARENLENLDRSEKEIIYAEWEAARDVFDPCCATDLDIDRYEEIINKPRPERYPLPDDILDTLIWEKASELRNCDNGGFNAWLCPFGCHTVPFNKE